MGPEIVSGKKILLVDDVFTSGATLNEASKMLKNYSVAKVIVAVCATVP